MPLTPDRARDIVARASVWPYWGNYLKFMTEEEVVHVSDLFLADPSGDVTFAKIINRIARSKSNAL